MKSEDVARIPLSPPILYLERNNNAPARFQYSCMMPSEGAKKVSKLHVGGAARYYIFKIAQ